MKRGFTLIELLVVIAILAVLAVAVVVVMNPAELLKQARDTTRVSDFAALNSAIGMYLADVQTSPSIGTGSTGFCTSGSTKYTSVYQTCTANATTTVTNAGWVPINFTSISSGSPLARLPLDPVNSATYFYEYSFASSSLTYELDATMESAKYSTSTSVVGTDGGNSTSVYEIGNDPGLDL